MSELPASSAVSVGVFHLSTSAIRRIDTAQLSCTLLERALREQICFLHGARRVDCGGGGSGILDGFSRVKRADASFVFLNYRFASSPPSPERFLAA